MVDTNEEVWIRNRLIRALSPGIRRGHLSVGDWGAVGTSIGPVRDENQDRALIAQYSDATDPRRDFRMIVLSDGMGGLPNGAKAATVTIASFVSHFLVISAPIPERLVRAAHAANHQVYHSLGGRGGATLSAVVIRSDGLPMGVNAGDSRIYAYDGAELRQASQDDTIGALADQGFEIEESAHSNALLQHVGMGQEFEPHLIDHGRLQPAKMLLLTSDGVHWLGHRVLHPIVEHASGAPLAVQRLLTMAEITGGRDNSTVVAVVPKWNEQSEAKDDESSLTVWTPTMQTSLVVRAAAVETATPTKVEKIEPQRIANAQPDAKRPKKAAAKSGKRVAKKTAPKGDVDQPVLPMGRGPLTIKVGEGDEGNSNGNS
jgi:serine/threonine protein phosphatase PrpC